MRCEVVITKSGAPAMRDIASGEVMHPGTGPGVEPKELYVSPSRLVERLSDPRAGGSSLVLLDVGLGAASNALAAWRVSEAAPSSARRLELVSFDHEMAALELALMPENLASFGLTDPAAQAAVRTLMTHGKHETERTSWRLVLGDFPVSLALEPVGAADIVFWDMYSARTNPKLWTVALFHSLRAACRDGATLHTTNTSTSGRTSMLLGGFAVGVSAGTGRSGETTIASTHHRGLQLPLGARWLARLGRSSAAFSSDVVDVAGALAIVRGLPQFSGGS